MSRNPSTFFLTWIVTTLAAILVSRMLPGTSLDRSTFESLARMETRPPLEISGKGTRSHPWTADSGGRKDESPRSLVTVALHDNLDGTFQGSPHAPIDLAVIFNNLQRLGARSLACAVLLAWEDPDPIGLTAMENTLEGFDSVVIAAPVTRGAIMQTLPSPFRRDSLPAEDLSGNVSLLPVVNRVSIPTLIYGGENTLAGFQLIDSEPAGGRMQLLARWDYRVVFAFPVVAAMQQLGLEAKDLMVHVGSHIRLGRNGPSIPIDSHGRLGYPVAPIVSPALHAVELLEAKPENFINPPITIPLLVDQRSHADLATRAFNTNAPSAIEVIKSGGGAWAPLVCVRLGKGVEMALLLFLAMVMSLTGLMGRALQTLACALALAGIAASQWWGFNSNLWLPGLAGGFTVMTAWLASMAWGKRRKRTTSMPRLDRLELLAGEESD